MRRKILSGIFALAFLATAGFGVSKSMKSNVIFNDLALANVEALAQSENDFCPNGCYSNGTGCYCYRFYENLEEAQW